MDRLTADWQELIDSFESHGVEFLVVGAHALALHGFPRNTADIDFWIRRTEENAHRVRLALDEFGFKIGDEGERKLAEDRNILFLGQAPYRVDILTFLEGCEFGTAWERREEGELDGRKVYFLSLEDYVSTKRAADRPKDRNDLKMLRKSLGNLPGDG